MRTSIKKELIEYINDNKDDHNPSIDCDLHHHLFNEDYYIIGYYQAQKWLDKHGISVFEALDTIREYEDFHFGECKSYTNAEETVNMLVYIYGEELLSEMDLI
tara:strand:- start:443 stop:751 length:309 start_codon:yes stop_codon:yes gene_type:complete